jgi:hypothetical protein
VNGSRLIVIFHDSKGCAIVTPFVKFCFELMLSRTSLIRSAIAASLSQPRP